jgi:hypothetical protein
MNNNYYPGGSGRPEPGYPPSSGFGQPEITPYGGRPEPGFGAGPGPYGGRPEPGLNPSFNNPYSSPFNAPNPVPFNSGGASFYGGNLIFYFFFCFDPALKLKKK